MSFISAIRNLLTPNKRYFVENKGITVVKRVKMNGNIVVTSYGPLRTPIKTITKVLIDTPNLKGHTTTIVKHDSGRVTVIQKYTKIIKERLIDALSKNKVIADAGDKINVFLKRTREKGNPVGIYFYRAEYPNSSNQVKVLYNNFGESISAEQIKTNFVTNIIA